MYDVIIIGGGPAGMMAAITAATNGNKVVLLEKNEKLGKKLYITGKGRCNVTNSSDVEFQLKQVTSNPKFLYSAFYSFDSNMVMDFFEKEGLKLKVERGQRVFPLSDKSSDVIRTLERAMENRGVLVNLRFEVKNIEKKDDLFKVESSDSLVYEARNLIIATGGISYDMTGSSGDGFRFAKQYKHQIVQPVQGLVPLETREKDILELQGLALKNVRLQMKVRDGKNKTKVYYDEIGEMLFTHFGVSGPLVLTASNYIPREYQSCQLSIDLKPALDPEKLDKRIIRDFEANLRKNIKNGLDGLLPLSMIPVVLKRAEIEETKVIDQVTKEERLRLLKVLKNFTLTVSAKRRFNEAIITRGGVNVKEIDPHTMESKKISHLYFAGEVLDVDALTGGFNLQIAFSTGYLAGNSIK